MEASRKKIIITLIALSTAFLLLLAWGLYVNAQFIVYTDNYYKFSIKYPRTWKIVVHPQPNVAVVFIRPKDTALDTTQENFSVTIQPVSEEDRVLAVFSARIKTQMTAVFDKNIKIVEDKPIRWGWREG